MHLDKHADALPPVYYYFFWLVEPFTTLLGAGYAVFDPKRYGEDLLPEGVERVTKIIGETSRGQMLIGALGSCFFLLALLSLSLFPLIKGGLAHLPHLQEKFVKRMLIPLAVADITHITLTLLPLPISLLQSPSRWTTLINGNVWITVFLFCWRMAYISGLGRQTFPQHRQPHSQKTVPLPKSSSRVVASVPSPKQSSPINLVSQLAQGGSGSSTAVQAQLGPSKVSPPVSLSDTSEISKTPRRSGRSRAKKSAESGEE